MRRPAWLPAFRVGRARTDGLTDGADEAGDAADAPWAPLLRDLAEADRAIDRLRAADAGTDAGRFERVEALLARAKALIALERPEEALAYAEEATAVVAELKPTEPAAELGVRAASRLAACLAGVERFGEAQAECRAVLDRLTGLPEPLAEEMRVRALLLVGWAEHKLDRSEASLEALRSLVARYGQSRRPEVTERVLVAELRVAFVLDALGRPTEAQEVRDAVVERHGLDQDREVREAVSMHLYARAQAHARQGDHLAALANLDLLLKRAREVPPPAGSKLVENALYLHADYLYRLGRPPEEVETERRAWVAIYDHSPLPSTQKRVAMLQGVLTALAARTEPSQAVESFTKWLDRFDRPATPAPAQSVARTLFLRAVTRRDQGDLNGALWDAEQVAERFGRSSDPHVAKVLRQTRVLLIVLLQGAGRLEEALAVARTVSREEPEPADEEARERVAKALGSQLDLLGRLGRTDEQVPVLDELIARFAETTDRDIHRSVMRAVGMDVRLLLELDRVADALALSEGLSARLQWVDGEAELLALGELSFAAAEALFHNGHEADALPAFVHLADLGMDADLAELRTLAGRASMFRVACLAALGQTEESEDAAGSIEFGPDMLPVLDDIAERSRDREAMPRKYLAFMLGARVEALDEAGRLEDARDAARDVVERFAQDDDPEVVEVVRELKAYLSSTEDDDLG